MPRHDRPDIGSLGLPELINYVRDGLGGTAWDKLAEEATDEHGEPLIAVNTLTNLGKLNRPIGRIPEGRTLIGAAAALKHRTTPWALMLAGGRSMKLPGCPTDDEMAAASSLFRGWNRMEATDFVVWNRIGEALYERRAVADEREELTRLRDEVAQLRAENDQLRAAAGS